MEKTVTAFDVKKYWVYLLADSGLVCVTTSATSPNVAVDMVVTSEACPKRAVVGVYDHRVTKTISGWKLQVNYGSGWEYETFETTYKAYLENKAAYEKNCPNPQKWTYGRSSNPEWGYIQHKIKELKA